MTAGVSVLARLLWSGVVGGFAIGGLVAVALFARAGPDEALTIFSSGAVVGVVAGVAVQLVNAVVLQVVRRTARGLTPNALRLVLTPLPAAAAPVLPALLVSSDAGAGTTALRWLPDDAAVAALVAQSRPQPWRTATQPVALTGVWERLPRTGVLCTFTLEQLRQMAPHAPVFAHMVDGDWTYVELPTWHWPMVSRPVDLATVLDSVVP